MAAIPTAILAVSLTLTAALFVIISLTLTTQRALPQKAGKADIEQSEFQLIKPRK